MVNSRAINAFFILSATSALCAQVRLMPELSNITVFNKGIPHQVSIGNSAGGQPLIIFGGNQAI